MLLVMCNFRIVCDVNCRYFFYIFVLFLFLGIEKFGVVDFFLLFLCFVYKIKFERNVKILNILYREKILNLID